MKEKNECKEKEKNIGKCYGGKCSNEQFNRCYPELKGTKTKPTQPKKEVKKMSREYVLEIESFSSKKKAEDFAKEHLKTIKNKRICIVSGDIDVIELEDGK